MMFQATPSVAKRNVRIMTCSGKGPLNRKGKAASTIPTPKAVATPLPATETLRAEPDDEQVEQEDDRVLVGGVEEVAAQRLHQTDQDPGDERARDAAESAQRDDGEGDGPEEAAHLRIDIVIHREEAACDPDQRGADAERERVDAVGVDPHEQRRVAVHLGGEDGLARPRPVQEEGETARDDDG